MKSKQQKAILIDLVHPKVSASHAKDRMVELEELISTHGGIEVVEAMQSRAQPHPKTFLGKGKIEDLGPHAEELEATVLVINASLKSRQIYELGEALREHGIQVWDRLDLILKIFAKHASTTEAQLEIELASIKHMGPRIFGMGMELSRQGGGVGTRGLGETNIERMKRHLKEKERKIKKKLETYQKGRALVRKGRERRGLKTVSIVGYTNAGKTTLLNKLTGRKEYVANELFATLDTRVGELWLPNKRKSVLLADTIGFIKELPPELLNAFASTLSEAVESDLLIHVTDASDEHLLDHVDVVEDILKSLGIHETPRMLVMNKIDQISDAKKKAIINAFPKKNLVWISASEDLGLEGLIERIEEEIG
ncbi:GTPase HflX [Candidatus Uhrbacteria bacterium]|jgi:GTPase|nr:GTPase HflX [Candidatus Uhrbacteria bacterium]